MTEKDLKVLLRAWGAYWRRVENAYPHQSAITPTTVLTNGRRPGPRVPIPDPEDDIWQVTQAIELLSTNEQSRTTREAIQFVRLYYMSGKTINEVVEVLEISSRQGSFLLKTGELILLTALNPLSLPDRRDRPV